MENGHSSVISVLFKYMLTIHHFKLKQKWLYLKPNACTWMQSAPLASICLDILNSLIELGTGTWHLTLRN